MFRMTVFVVLLCHTAFSLFILQKSGYWSVFPPFNELHTMQIFLDLAISLSLVTYLIYTERKHSRESLWPVFFVAIGAIFLGSIAPLVYFLFLQNKRKSRLLS